MIAVVAAALLAAASPVVDRTVVCSVARGDGHPDPPPRYLNVSASPKLADRSPTVNTWDVGFSNLGFSVGANTGRSGLVWIDRVECEATQARVSLSGAGLRPIDTKLGATYRCEVPAKVRIRLRAVFTRPVTLLGQRGQLIARGTVSTASLAVRTATGRPVFFGSAENSTGKAAALVAPGRCSKR